jgi:hypothetical protein
MKKATIHLKALTVTTQEFDEAIERVNRQYQVFDILPCGEGQELWTIIYQDAGVLVEYNLNQLTVKRLEELCQQEGIATVGERMVKRPIKREEIEQMHEDDQHKVEWKEMTWDEYWAKWKFVRVNLDNLFDPKASKKWRDNVLASYGLPTHYDVWGKGKYTKKTLVNKLIMSSAYAWDSYKTHLIG